jgi:hypothetical protein
VVGLDSGADYFFPPELPPLGAGLSNGQISGLEIDLSGHQNNYIFLHHPVLREGGGTLSTIEFNRDNFIDLCANYDVEAVFSGHTHVDEMWSENGTAFYQTPSATLSNPPGYRVIKITGDEKFGTFVYEPYNLNVTYSPVDWFRGTESTLTATVINDHGSRFENMFLKFVMPIGEYGVSSTDNDGNPNALIVAKIPYGDKVVYYIRTDLAAGETKQVTLSPTVTINNPIPTIMTLNPTSAKAGGAAFTLTVNGTNFVNGSTVRWNGSDRATTFVSPTQLTAVIPAADITAAGVPIVTVFNPAPGGGNSNGLPFFITTTGAAVTGYNVATGADPTATFGGVTANATGNGTLVVAQYASNPGGMPTFAATGQYFDVYISGTFTSVTVDICGLASGTPIYFWTGTAWVAASNQSYSAGCVTVTVNATTVPTLTQLAGAIFGVGHVEPTSFTIFLPLILR